MKFISVKACSPHKYCMDSVIRESTREATLTVYLSVPAVICNLIRCR